MPGSLNDFLAASLDRKRLSAQGHTHTGLFLLFRGDSFMRNTMVAMLKTMTDNPSVIGTAAFDKSHYHLAHLFCCKGYHGSGSNLRFYGCVLEYETSDFTRGVLEQLVRSRMAGGQVCLAWELRPMWSEQEDRLGGWLGAAAPDVLVVNGGLHYHDWGPGQSFEREFDAAMAAFDRALSSPRGSRTSLVIVSSSYNSYHEWEPQRAAYEHVREFVKGWHSEAVRGRVSYVDFHTMAGLDSCGFSHKFPPARFQAAGRDACGNGYVNDDIHLAGGAYLHLAEIVAFGLFRERRRCDPPAFEPLSIGEWRPSGEDAKVMSRYINLTLVRQARKECCGGGNRERSPSEYMDPNPERSAARD